MMHNLGLQIANSSCSRSSAHRVCKLNSRSQFCGRGYKLQKAASQGYAEVNFAPGSAYEDCDDTNWQRPLPAAGAVVALGKFDALHLGHRSLAVAASAIGSPVLLSFSGMAEVLGWPANLPLVAPVDRPRVLASWSDACGGKPVSARVIPFALIRRMPPEEFVRLLAQDLKAAGVVAGANYRFGYKAQGDTAALLRLGPQYGLKVQIADIVEDRREAAAENGIPSTITNSLSADKSVMSNVMDTAGASSSLSNSGFDLGLSSSEAGPPSKPGISGAGSALQLCSSFECDTEGTRISSSRVRELLSKGHVDTVAQLLGRPYRLTCALDALQPSQASCSSTVPGSRGGGTSGNGVADSGASNRNGSQAWRSNQHESFQAVCLPTSSFQNQPPVQGVYSASLHLYDAAAGTSMALLAGNVPSEGMLQVQLDSQGLVLPAVCEQACRGDGTVNGQRYLMVDLHLWLGLKHL